MLLSLVVECQKHDVQFGHIESYAIAHIRNSGLLKKASKNLLGRCMLELDHGTEMALRTVEPDTGQKKCSQG